MNKSPKTPEKQSKKRKPESDVLGIRIERETKAKLSQIAKIERRSLSGQVLLFIEQGVKHREDALALRALKRA